MYIKYEITIRTLRTELPVVPLPEKIRLPSTEKEGQSLEASLLNNYFEE
jgi:hypothetical protein